MNTFAKIVIGALVASTALPCLSANLSGSWSGNLKVSPQQSLKLVFNISPEMAVTMDSPDQGAYGIECKTVFISDDSLNIKVPRLGVNFAGHIVGEKLEGTFKQGFMKLPLSLTAGVKKANRPQTPVAPFPYTTEEVRVSNVYGNSVLAGTLTIPDNLSKKTPVVVLVSGSGLQNRDEELFEHKPFAVIADYLARNGIASLRYDDRGFGESTGDVSNATTEDFASDTKAVVDWIRKSRRFGKIGIIGHSEGGQIAYMLAARKGKPDFIVSIAGPAIKGTKTIAYQNKQALLKSNIPLKEAEDFEAAVEKVFDFNLSNTMDSICVNDIVAELYPQHNDSPLTRQLSTLLADRISSGESSNPWMKYFLAYDPQSDMKKIKIPALIIYGEKDRQVPADLNAEPARKYSPKAKVNVYPGLNHLMQHAESGNVEEYREIEETISPEVLSDIVTFINSL